MTADPRTPFEQALASQQPKPRQPPEMRVDRLHYELEATRAQVAELAAALRELLAEGIDWFPVDSERSRTVVQSTIALLAKLDAGEA